MKLKTFMDSPKIVLASASPRRAALLRQIFSEFAIVESRIAELDHDQLTANEVAQINAFRKARAVAQTRPDALVIGADTVVCLGRKIFGKPADLDEAARMLAQLQGRTHQVVTGVCLMEWRRRRCQVFAEMTQVQFRALSPLQIRKHLAGVQPLDKAGGYALQEHGDQLAQKVAGSLSNVIGLPLERLQIELAAWASRARAKTAAANVARSAEIAGAGFARSSAAPGRL